MMRARDIQFLEFVRDSSLISRTELQAIAQEAEALGRDVADMLVHRGKLSEADVRKIKSHVYGIPFVDLTKRTVPFDVLVLVPEPFARRHNAIVYETDDEAVYVAVLDLETLTAIEDVLHMEKKIIPRFTNIESVRHALKQYQTHLKRMYGDSIMRESGFLKHATGENEDLALHTSAVHIVDELIKHALLSHASYVHIDPALDTVSVRYRIYGRMYTAMTLPGHVLPAVASRLRMLSHIDAGTIQQAGAFKVLLDNDIVSCKTAFYPTLHGEKILIRMARGHASGFTLEGLGLHGEALEMVHDALMRTRGMIVVAGGESSGKTTLLYTMLDMLNVPQRSLVTVEDPVEYEMPGVMQMRVREDVGMTYLHTVRRASHLDADVLMVSDVSVPAVADIVLRTATRHTKVLGGLSARGAAHALSELIEKTEQDELLINGGLSLVVATKLLPSLGPDKQAYTLTSTDIERLAKHVDMDKVLSVLREEGIVAETTADWKTIPFYKAGQQGSLGVTAVHEVLPITLTMKELIMRGASVRELDAQSRREGMAGFLEDALYKAVLGLVEIDEVLKIHGE